MLNILNLQGDERQDAVDAIAGQLSDKTSSVFRNMFANGASLRIKEQWGDDKPGWSPCSKTIQAFIDSESIVAIINGPYGSGKTIATFMKQIKVCLDPITGIKPDTYGWRRAINFVIRRHEKEVKDGEMTTFHEWFKRIDNGPNKNFSEGNTHRILLERQKVELIFKFFGGGQDLADFANSLRGISTTTINIGEIDWAPIDIIQAVLTRIGRYPSIINGGGAGIVVGATNGYTVADWLYNEFNKSKTEVKNIDNQATEIIRLGSNDYRTNWSLFTQPPAILEDNSVNPNCDNIKNLPKNYYENMISKYQREAMGDEDALKWKIDKELKIKIVAPMGQRAVYPTFNRIKHVIVKNELAYHRGAPMVIGYDGGGFGLGIVAGQLLSNGRLVIFDEYLSTRNIMEDTPMILKRFINDNMKLCTPSSVTLWADPANFNPAANNPGGASEAEWVGRHSGIKFKRPVIKMEGVSSRDEISIRRNAVMEYLYETIVDKKPRIQITTNCSNLIAGFEGGYNFKKTSQDMRSRNITDNKYTHIHDALQYLVLGVISNHGSFDGTLPFSGYNNVTKPITAKMARTDIAGMVNRR